MSDANHMLQQQPPWLGIVRRQVTSLRFGCVRIVVHDSQTTQLETTEKLRFENNSRVGHENQRREGTSL